MRQPPYLRLYTSDAPILSIDYCLYIVYYTNVWILQAFPQSSGQDRKINT